MSERTPQDVLREAAQAVVETEAKRVLNSPTHFGALWKPEILALKEALGKAIAEAPDSPHCDHGMSAHGPEGCLHCDCTVPGFKAKVSDTLSEKPGLDVERLTEALAHRFRTLGPPLDSWTDEMYRREATSLIRRATDSEG